MKQLEAFGIKTQFIRGDTTSYNKMSQAQLKSAAYKGGWKCHGYYLEPDAECPKCGRSMFE